MHEHKIVHRDVRLGSYLLTADGRGKKLGPRALLRAHLRMVACVRAVLLGRLSLAYRAADGPPADNNPLIVRCQAPEVLLSKKFSVQSDVFSFGVFLFELATKQVHTSARCLDPSGQHSCAAVSFAVSSRSLPVILFRLRGPACTRASW